MTTLAIRRFGGIAPIRDRSKLSDVQSQTAENCLFEGGNLRAERAPVEVALSYPFQSSITRSVFRLTDAQWLRWTGDVAAVRGPAPVVPSYLGLGDDYRIYYAGTTGDSITWPRFTTKYRAMGNVSPATYFDGPAVSYPLGVPAPQSVPTVATSAAPSRNFSTLVKGNPVAIQTVEPPNLKNGDRVLLSGLPATGDGSELNNNQYAVSVYEGGFKLDSADGSAWTGNVVGSFTWTRVYADEQLEDRIYVYTYVNEFGEEGAPSLPSVIVSVGEGQTVEVGMDTASAITIGSGPTFAVLKKRIYRSVSGSTELVYQFVAEVDIATPTYTDALDVVELGEVLATELYDLPPADLQGLVLHPNGFLVGFVRNQLYASEPYLPYAWPTDYIKTLEEEIVGLEIMGSTIVILTKSRPHFAPCTDPASIAPQHAPHVYPCVHRQASCVTGDAVVYVSPVGLVSFSPSGPVNLTVQYFSEPQWRVAIGNAVKSPIVLEFVGNRVWMLTEGDGLYAFDMREPGHMDVCTHPIVGTTMALNPETAQLFVMYGNTSQESSRRLFRFFGDSGARSTYTWKSGRFILQRDTCFAWAQVRAEQYHGGSNALALNIYYRPHTPRGQTQAADESYSIQVTDDQPFVLPAGFLSDQWTIELVGNCDVKWLVVADSIGEIKRWSPE